MVNATGLDEKEAGRARFEELSSYVWREKTGGRNEFADKPLVEYDEASLQQFYNLCKEMLYNNDSKNPGRMKVLAEINLQRKNCNIMLFLRYIRKRYGETEYTLHETLRQYIVNNRENYPDIDKQPVGNYVMGNCPADFKNVRICELMSACMDSLGAFTARHVTKRLIFEQGIYLTDKDKKELVPTKEEFDSIIARKDDEGVDVFRNKDGKLKIGKLELIRHRLGISNSFLKERGYRMYVSKTGLTYDQFKAMICLPSKAKYSELTTDQLHALRDRILPTLEIEVDKHIKQWKRRMQEIREVAEYRGYRITTLIGNRAEP